MPFNFHGMRSTFYLIILKLHSVNITSRFLDTSLVEVDVQSNYIRITVKGKIFQLHLSEEVNITKSTSQRSTLTGHLLIVMPKLIIPNNLNCNNLIGNDSTKTNTTITKVCQDLKNKSF